MPVELVETGPPAANAVRGIRDPGVSVLDLVALVGILAVFVVLALIAKGVEKL